ncbi:MAG: VOC family protein [Sulfuricaulis sp.]|uniref:VOC family protein n=1 Tax=Sulfuricaulis sp. TaxID=2003553 RepID=UPI0025FDEE97|nr:VOC family protein [Sulfuricaulis sp.]MCR4346625.1 VOC family protein [Sulfuricaulis sp.]
MVTLGHVVFYVRDLEKSVAFYQNVVGLEIDGRIFSGHAAMLTGGSTHHELLLIEVGAAPGPLQGKRIGLYHVGWKVGESLDDLRQVRDRIRAHGHDIEGMSDHTVSQSLYLRDPDGNEIELFVDDPGVDWRHAQEWMEAPVKPLRL